MRFRNHNNSISGKMKLSLSKKNEGLFLAKKLTIILAIDQTNKFAENSVKEDYKLEF